MNKKQKRGAQVRSSALLGCNSLLIVTPSTPKYQLDEMEAWAEIILGWDGKRLSVIKWCSRLNEPSPLALRRVAASLPTAARGSIVNYCGAPAKLNTHLVHQRGSDGWPTERYRRNEPRENAAASLPDNRPKASLKSNRSKSDTQRSSNRKVARSYVRGAMRPNDPSSATAAGNARSAATIADKLPEPSDCPAGRRFAAAHWLGHNIVN